uniref:Proline-rich transmembrane protein 2 n=1 Tax=Astyanax mexicanus TaxID=7994 RepID=A0A3B1KFU7_ASTMX
MLTTPPPSTHTHTIRSEGSAAETDGEAQWSTCSASSSLCSSTTCTTCNFLPPRLHHAHSNGRARLSSRSGSLSYAGSPRPSLSRQPSAATEATIEGTKPKDYLFLAIIACICPVWPINIVGLTFSVMSLYSLQQGNVDGARRLGRNAKILSILSIVGGILLITTGIVINWGCK